MEMMEEDDDNIDSPGPNQGVTGLNQGSQSVGRSGDRSSVTRRPHPCLNEHNAVVTRCCRPPMVSSPTSLDPRLKERDAFVVASVDTLTLCEEAPPTPQRARCCCRRRRRRRRARRPPPRASTSGMLLSSPPSTHQRCARKPPPASQRARCRRCPMLLLPPLTPSRTPRR